MGHGAGYGIIPLNLNSIRQEKKTDMKGLAACVAFLMFAFMSAAAGGGNTNAVSSVAALMDVLRQGRSGVPFEITATIIHQPCSDRYAVQDATGAVIIELTEPLRQGRLSQGDHVHIQGKTVAGFLGHSCYAIGETANVLSRETIPLPVEADAAGLAGGRFDNRLIRFKGMVVDTFRDEIDPQWIFLVLKDGHESFYACYAPNDPDATIGDLIGAEIAITGFYSALVSDPRFHSGRYILFSGRDAISVLRPAPDDPFDVPLLTAKHHDSAAAINGMERRRVTGRVIAVWHGDRMLLRTAEGRITRVDLADRRPPSYGITVDAVGQPETDLYRLNLSRGIWRTNDLSVAAEPLPVDVTAWQMLHDYAGRPAIQIEYHGRGVRLKGLVRSLPSFGYSDGRLALECDQYIVPVDASACPQAFADVEIGCTLEVAGICIIETENWRPNAPFPHVDGFSVVVRTPKDVRILSRPPWWTAGRLLSVIGALLATLVGVFLWNRQLNRLAERRGRELTEETIARATADLKVGERTRLAIELHDALSQNLTGAALEIETSDVLIDDSPAQAHHHLDIAAKTVKSCREELRNCLWDLRNDALGEKTMDEAIRRTLTPFLDGTGLVVRFNVPRERLSDDTAHAFLRIIRELAQNAIRHGHAKMVKIAGCLESNRLLFSVSDNGCGFDPQNHPGVLQGHFGLQGIRERVNRFGGTVEIASAPGKGTKVSITIGTVNREGKVLEEAVAHETNQSPAC